MVPAQYSSVFKDICYIIFLTSDKNRGEVFIFMAKIMKYTLTNVCAKFQVFIRLV